MKADNRELFLTFLKIGAFTFGGGYAMLSLIEDEIVSKKKWVSPEEFLDMTAIAESTPGPMAINSATYLGYKIGGVSGATCASVAVCIPSFIIIFLISIFYEVFKSISLVASAFSGIQVCVVLLVLSAGLKMLKAMDKNVFNILLCLANLAIFLGISLSGIGISSIWLILLSGVTGMVTTGIRRLKEAK